MAHLTKESEGNVTVVRLQVNKLINKNTIANVDVRALGGNNTFPGNGDEPGFLLYSTMF